MNTTHNSRAVQRDATRSKIVEVARSLFTSQGFAQTSTDDIIRGAMITRGALYHHFSSKELLFLAVLEDVQRHVASKVELAVRKSPTDLDALVGGCKAFVKACLEPDVQQVMLIDGPSVAGWAAWREIDARYSSKSLTDGLSALGAAGRLRGDAVSLAHLLSGALNEAALWIAQAPNKRSALTSTVANIDLIIESLLFPA
jgi:AcrR family transcriptional regulator